MDTGNKKTNRISINFIYQTAYQILVIISPLITVPYIARVLGSENNGIYTYTFTIVNYFVIFSALGIEAYGNRLIARSKTISQDVLNQAFSSLFWLHIIVTSLVAIIYLIYIIFIASEYRAIFAIQGLWVLGAFFDVNWLFFGLEEFKLSVTRNFVIKICSIAFIFLLVRDSSDLWLYTLIIGGGQLFSNIFLWRYITNYVSFKKVSLSEVFFHIKPLLVLFFAVIATSIYRMIDKVMVGKLCNMNDLASYEYADRMIRLLLTLITALGTVMLPRMTALYAENKNEQAEKYMESTTQIMFVIASALAFGLASVADDFMPLLLGEGYESSILFTQVLCISLPIMGWNNLIRTQVLMPKEKDKVYVIAVWVGAIVNIILNLILINYIGAKGAAIATVISYAIVGICQIYPIWNEFKIGVLLRHSVIPLFGGSVMFIIVRLTHSLWQSNVLRLIMSVFIGALFYVLFAFFYLIKSNNDVLNTYLKKLKKFNKKC